MTSDQSSGSVTPKCDHNVDAVCSLCYHTRRIEVPAWYTALLQGRHADPVVAR